jgi:hypothetical protein
MFLAMNVFHAKSDDLQHEMGHALADLDHTIFEPDWFYKGELLHYGSAKPVNVLKMTRHKIYVGGVVNDAGTWKNSYHELATGYGGAVRAYIAQERGAWVVNQGWNGWS